MAGVSSPEASAAQRKSKAIVHTNKCNTSCDGHGRRCVSGQSKHLMILCLFTGNCSSSALLSPSCSMTPTSPVTIPHPSTNRNLLFHVTSVETVTLSWFKQHSGFFLCSSQSPNLEKGSMLASRAWYLCMQRSESACQFIVYPKKIICNLHTSPKAGLKIPCLGCRSYNHLTTN